ncbi:membrane protein [Bacteroidia bacterium]|nr:membrane protein [Bacteroidia bacterium]
MKKLVIAGLLSMIFTLAVQAGTEAQESESLFQQVENWYNNNMNYGTITVLMAAESSIFPVPSELVIPPAAYIAASDESDLNIFLVILFGTIGALIGATVNYFVLGLWIGRPLLYKFADSKAGRLLLLSSEKLQKAEDYFNAHGIVSTFVGRFIPVVRHLISIPAGFAKMNFSAFAFFTFVGAGLWNCILALLGYLAHGQSDMIEKYSHELSYILLGLGGLFVLYLVYTGFIKKKKDIS